MLNGLTRVIGYPDLQASLLPFASAQTLSPLFSLTTALKMALLVTMVAVLVACGAGLIIGTVTVASAVGTDCRTGPRVGSLGPWVLG